MGKNRAIRKEAGGTRFVACRELASDPGGGGAVLKDPRTIQELLDLFEPRLTLRGARWRATEPPLLIDLWQSGSHWNGYAIINRHETTTSGSWEDMLSFIRASFNKKVSL